MSNNWKHTFVTLSFGAIILIMSQFTWGDLPKSQIDNQLITEAIALAITNHEEDPTAHLGAGESLEQHKTNDILDHPAASIPGDKFSSGLVTIFGNFESIDGYQKTAGVTCTFPGVKLLTTAITNNLQSLIAESFEGMYGIDFNKSPLFQITAVVPSWSNVLLAFGHGSYAVGDDNVFLGFTFESSVFKATIKIESTLYQVTLTTPDTARHIYRAFVDPVTHDALFYIDGVLVATIDAGDYYANAIDFTDDPVFFTAYVKTLTASAKSITLSNLLISTQE